MKWHDSSAYRASYCMQWPEVRAQSNTSKARALSAFSHRISSYFKAFLAGMTLGFWKASAAGAAVSGNRETYTLCKVRVLDAMKGGSSPGLKNMHKHCNGSWWTLSITLTYSFYPLYGHNGCPPAIKSALQGLLDLEPEGGTLSRGNFHTSPNIILYRSILFCSSDFCLWLITAESKWNYSKTD